MARADGRDRRASDREYRASHAAERAAYDKAYIASHREWSRAYSIARNAALKMDALEAYGGPICACCGETLFEGLTIDHLNGGGSKHRRSIAGGDGDGGGSTIYQWLKRHRYPAGYQVLCATCNTAKGTRDHCPHEELRAHVDYAPY